MVRVELWFGLEQHQSDWTAREKSEGDFAVLAETVSYRLQIGEKSINNILELLRTLLLARFWIIVMQMVDLLLLPI